MAAPRRKMSLAQLHALILVQKSWVQTCFWGSGLPLTCDCLEVKKKKSSKLYTVRNKFEVTKRETAVPTEGCGRVNFTLGRARHTEGVHWCLLQLSGDCGFPPLAGASPHSLNSVSQSDKNWYTENEGRGEGCLSHQIPGTQNWTCVWRKALQGLGRLKFS